MSQYSQGNHLYMHTAKLDKPCIFLDGNLLVVQMVPNHVKRLIRQ